MSEYISTKELGEFMADFHKNMPAFFKWTELLWAMSKIPRADVVERKTGKWIFTYDHGGPNRAYFCSKCKKTIHTADLDAWSFCPNCGAQMIGGDDDV